MTKHNQTKSLGPLTNFQSAPEPTPETTDERIHRLERRILQVETLLNDVMQQLDKPYRDQSLFDGKPHGNGKPNPVKPKPNPVNPKQAKPKQAKPKAEKAKKAQTPPVPPATEEQTQAHAEAIIAFLSPYPEKLWHGTKLRKSIQKHCATSSQRATLAIKLLRRTGHLLIVKDVEVDGSILKGAYQFVPDPQTPEADTKPQPPTPPKPALPEEKSIAESVITFLNQEPDRLWHGSTLRTEIQKNCDLSSDQVAPAIKNLRKSRHIVVVRNVEVDGEMLDGALQFVSNPQPQTEKEKKAAKKAVKKAGAVAWARRTADAFEKLQSLLLSGDRITTTELLAADINFILQERVRESDAYKESGIQSTQLDDGTHEYSIESTD